MKGKLIFDGIVVIIVCFIIHVQKNEGYMISPQRITKGLTLAEGELLIIAVRTPKA